MKWVLIVVLSLGLSACHEDCPSAKCGQEALVKDLGGLDGCGLVFELNDGKILEPERRTYVMAPSKEDDPLYHFDLKAGQRVTIACVDIEGATACMAGDLVFITCIELSEEN